LGPILLLEKPFGIQELCPADPDGRRRRQLTSGLTIVHGNTLSALPAGEIPSGLEGTRPRAAVAR
jgi:hypothetical protein